MTSNALTLRVYSGGGFLYCFSRHSKKIVDLIVKFLLRNVLKIRDLQKCK